MNKRVFWVILFLFLFGFVLVSYAAQAPGQPTTGPGGTEYPFMAVKKTIYEKGDQSYWIFEPDQPRPSRAPVIVFNHGWGATNPKAYGAWIEHLVRRGNIVIYPSYQNPGKIRYPPQKITQNTIQAVIHALDRLNVDDHVRPDRAKFAIVGHSAGGQVTANMAALAKENGLPIPKAVMVVQPGKSWNRRDKRNIPLEDLRKIPSTVLLLTVVGDKDRIVRDIDAKRIFNESTQVPLKNKDFVTVLSDNHGKPSLKADHFSPTALNNAYDSGGHRRQGFFRRRRAKKRLPNALDYYGYWKLFDALCDAGFYGKNREFALGGTSRQKFMGKWSDGAAVKQLVVTKTP